MLDTARHFTVLTEHMEFSLKRKSSRIKYAEFSNYSNSKLVCRHQPFKDDMVKTFQNVPKTFITHRLQCRIGNSAVKSYCWLFSLQYIFQHLRVQIQVFEVRNSMFLNTELNIQTFVSYTLAVFLDFLSTFVSKMFCSYLKFETVKLITNVSINSGMTNDKSSIEINKSY